MTIEPPNRRRWFQFRLRTLLVAVLVLSLPLSWFAVRMRQREAVEAIEALGGRVSYDHTGPSVPEWIRESVGDDFFYDVVQVRFRGTDITDAGLDHLGGLTKLQVLCVDDTEITDAGLEHLEGLTNLLVLSLDGTEITDAGLEHLKGLTNLKALTLHEPQITDAGLKHLKGLTNLERLSLTVPQVTDAGLEHLTGLTRLEILYVHSTHFTDQGVNVLRGALPNCGIGYKTAPLP